MRDSVRRNVMYIQITIVLLLVLVITHKTGLALVIISLQGFLSLPIPVGASVVVVAAKPSGIPFARHLNRMVSVLTFWGAKCVIDISKPVECYRDRFATVATYRFDFAVLESFSDIKTCRAFSGAKPLLLPLLTTCNRSELLTAIFTGSYSAFFPALKRAIVPGVSFYLVWFFAERLAAPIAYCIWAFDRFGKVVIPPAFERAVMELMGFNLVSGSVDRLTAGMAICVWLLTHLDSKIKLPRRPGAVVEAATQKAFGGASRLYQDMNLNKKCAQLGKSCFDTDIIAQVS